MKQGWETKQLKEIGITQTGTTPKTSEKENYGDFIPFIKPADVNFSGSGDIRYDNDGLSETGLEKGRKMASGSILMVCIGATIGKVGFAEMDVSCNQQLNSLTVKKEFDPKFIYYAMTSIKFQDKVLLEGKGSQATLPIINKSKWENLTISYSKSLPEQQRIVSILDQAFAALAKAKANAEQNLKNARELFESYLQGVFEKKGEDWEEKTLGEVCEKIQDGAHHSPKDLYPERKEGLFPYITSKNIRNSYMDLSKMYFVDENFHMSIYPRCKPEIGDVLLTKDGANTGNITLNTLDEPFSLLSSVCLIKTNRDKLQPEFLKYYIQSPMGFKSITGKMTGAAIKRIILKAIKSAKIPLPTLRTQKTLVIKLDALSAETKRLEAIYQQKIADLEELKKSILQKAFNGELSESRIEMIKG